MRIPSQLAPNDQEMIVLSEGEEIAIPKCRTTFLEWKGDVPPDTYGSKQVLDFDGQPLFAELFVLRLFGKEGWKGVWVDTYGKKYRVGLPGIAEPVTLPAEQIAMIERISAKAGSFKGCWDVFLWNGNKNFFVELKRKKKDVIRETQVHWLEASLSLGFTSADFLIVEWETVEM